MSIVSDVLVVVPARNESARIGRCLRSICTALAVARQAGIIRRTRIAVAAHRCVDDTAEIARNTLRGRDDDHLISTVVDDLPVGLVRTRLAHHAIGAGALDPERLWLFSTDADSTVPSDWITGLLAAADHGRADLVAGLVDIDRWQAGPDARRRYRRLIASKLRPDGGHDHVYAANLAVRWTIFQQLQGFPGVPHGEESALLHRARAEDVAIATPRSPRVRTSGRTIGRAPQGLAALLRQLE